MRNYLRLFRHEFRRTISDEGVKRFIICIVIMQCIALFYWLNTKGFLYTTNDYKLFFDSIEKNNSEDINEKLDQMLTNDNIRNQLISFEIRKEVENTQNYEWNIQQKIETCKQMLQSGLLVDEDGYFAQNIRQYIRKYEDMPPLDIEVGPSKGIELLGRFWGIDISGFLFSVFLVFMVIVKERENGSFWLTRTGKLGRRQLGICKYIVCNILNSLLILVMECMDVLLLAKKYGLGRITRAIQSVSDYQGCVFPISIRSFLIVLLALHLLAGYIYTSVLFCIAVGCESLVAYINRCLVVFGTEMVFFESFSSNHSLGFLHDFNIWSICDVYEWIGGYRNINFFGLPIWYLPAYIFVGLIVSAFTGVYGIWLYGRNFSFVQTDSFFCGLCRLFSKKSVSVLWHEFYRIMVGEKLVFLFLFYLVFQIASFKPMEEGFYSIEDIYWKQYMIEMEGYSIEQQREFLAKERKDYETATREYQEALERSLESTEMLQMKYIGETGKYALLDRLTQYTDYLEEHGGVPFYDGGYRILLGDSIGQKYNQYIFVWNNVLFIICIIYLFRRDCQTETEMLVHTTLYGRKKLIRRRMLIGMGEILLLMLLGYTPFFYNVFCAYGTQGLFYPICSMEMFYWVPEYISVIEYIILIMMCRFLILMAEMCCFIKRL